MSKLIIILTFINTLLFSAESQHPLKVKYDALVDQVNNVVINHIHLELNRKELSQEKSSYDDIYKSIPDKETKTQALCKEINARKNQITESNINSLTKEDIKKKVLSFKEYYVNCLIQRKKIDNGESIEKVKNLCDNFIESIEVYYAPQKTSIEQNNVEGGDQVSESNNEAAKSSETTFSDYIFNQTTLIVFATLILNTLVTLLIIWGYHKTNNVKNTFVYLNEYESDKRRIDGEIIKIRNKVSGEVERLNRHFSFHESESNKMPEGTAVPKEYFENKIEANRVNNGIYSQPPLENVGVSEKIVLYAQAPRNDGSFDERRLYEIIKEDSLFELVFDSNKASGIVRIVNNPAAQKTAIDIPNQYLSSVCKYRGNPSNSHSRIITDKPGVLKKQGDYWKVDPRIFIHFE